MTWYDILVCSVVLIAYYFPTLYSIFSRKGWGHVGTLFVLNTFIIFYSFTGITWVICLELAKLNRKDW